MPEIDVIPIDAVDFRPDPYLKIRCGTCGVEWGSHPDDLNCSRYRPAEHGPLDGATIANIPGENTRGRGQMQRYPHEVCPPAHLMSKGGE